MLIGQLSKEVNLSKDTIRFYVKQGLITPKPGNSEYNNYKEYTEREVQQLRFITKAKSFGFTLKEIAGTLEEMEQEKANCVHLKNKALNKVIEIDKKIAELQKYKSNILKEIKQDQSPCAPMQPKSNCPRVLSFFSI